MAKIPTYDITIDDAFSDGEDLGISMIAFTSRPAIKIKGMAFNEEAPKMQYFSDDTKYQITAPAMVPMQIYRLDDEDDEYYVRFTESEIDKIHAKFMANYTSTGKFNLEHDSNEVVPAYLLDTWSVEYPESDKAKTKFDIDVPKGTRMMNIQLTDKEYYNKLVANNQTGLSIEGYLGMKLTEEIKQKIKEEKMNSQKGLKLDDGGTVSAYIDLPVGTHTIGDKVYTVVEIIENAGMENEWKRNVIESMVPVAAASTEAAPAEDTTTLSDEEAPKEVEETKLADAEPVASGETEAEKTELAEGDAAIVADAPAETEGEAAYYSKKEVDDKLDELYRIIGELKSDVKDEVTESEKSTEDVKLSVHDKFSAFSNFMKTTPNVRLT